MADDKNGNVKWTHFIPFVITTVTILLALGGWIVNGFCRNVDEHIAIKEKLTTLEAETAGRLARIETKIDYMIKQDGVINERRI